MIVKAFPNKPLVDAGEEACISITPVKRRARSYQMGTLYLTGVKFVIDDTAGVVGDNQGETVERYYPSERVLSFMTRVSFHESTGRFVTVPRSKRMRPLDVTDKSFKVAVIVGPDVYVR